MNLYLIRHLPTNWNKKGWLQGLKDIDILPLDSLDEERVKINLELLKEVEFDEIYVSDLKRTQQTASAYGFNECVVNTLINELNFGKFEGKEKHLMLDEIGEAWFNNFTTVELGEKIIDFDKRIKEFLDEIKEKQNVLIFSHGAVIRALIAIFKEGGVDNMNKIVVENNSLSILNFLNINK